MSLSPEQLERRLEGITATDLAAIVGVHPHRSRIDVWREKRGEGSPWVDTDRSRWGELLEPVIRRDYADRHDVRVEVPGTLAHPDAPWMLATPDGVAYVEGDPTPKNGLEIKCHTFRLMHLYGTPGTDEIPLHELCQVSWNLAVTGLERWDVVAFIDGQPTEYVVDRDDALIDQLRDQARRFLVDNVQGGSFPEPDGHDNFDTWLQQRWPSSAGGLIDIGNDLDTFALIERAKELRATGTDVEQQLKLIQQQLKVKIADAEGLLWRTAKGKTEKLTWRRSKPSKRIDLAGMARDARNDAALTASGLGPDIKRAILCLQSLGPQSIGHSSQAAITATEIVSTLVGVRDALERIAHQTEAAYTTEIPGNRPFCYPRNWKAPSSAKEE